MAQREMGRQSSRAPDHSATESRYADMMGSIVGSGDAGGEITAVRRLDRRGWRSSQH